MVALIHNGHDSAQAFAGRAPCERSTYCNARDSQKSRLSAKAFSRYRQLASVITGGPVPLIAIALLSAYHTGFAIAIYIAACAVVSLMPDYTGKDISAEYAATTA